MVMGEASASEGRLRVWLNADKVWACWKCHTHLASQLDKKPRRYHGYYGSAYLFRKVVNVKIVHGDPLVVSSDSGFETVVKARCIGCGEEVGQKYVRYSQPGSVSGSVFVGGVLRVSRHVAVQSGIPDGEVSFSDRFRFLIALCVVCALVRCSVLVMWCCWVAGFAGVVDGPGGCEVQEE